MLAIALQNVPDGTASAIPTHDAGFSRAQQFWAAVATGVPQAFTARTWRPALAGAAARAATMLALSAAIGV